LTLIIFAFTRTICVWSTQEKVTTLEGFDKFTAELCSRIFDSMPRSDQSRWGRLYVRGLLSVEGKKTIRNIASLVQKKQVEQNLHHFMSKSPWDWRPMRRLLAQYVDEVMGPQAWVIEQMVIPKKGSHTVGVERGFVPQLGRIVNNQKAFGVWLATNQDSCPVNWRLVLPPEWVTSPGRRDRADIPDSLNSETPGVCALNAALEMAGTWDLGRRPVIVDARYGDAHRMVAEFVARGVPFLIRIGDSIAVAATNPTGGHSQRLGPAHQFMEQLRMRRQPVEWIDAKRSVRRSLAASLDIVLPITFDRPARRQATRLVLLAEWAGHAPEPAELWLTNLADVSPGFLVRLSKLVHRVARDFSRVCTRVGIQDFEGRSFKGWHRHATLASVAHAVAMTAMADRRGSRTGMQQHTHSHRLIA